MESCSQSCSSTFFSQSLIRRGNWTSSVSTHGGITKREKGREGGRAGLKKKFSCTTLKGCRSNHAVCTVVNSHICMAQCSPGEVCDLSWCPPGCIQWQRVHMTYHMFCCLSHKPKRNMNATIRCKQWLNIPVQPSAGYGYLHDQTHSHWEDIVTALDTHSLAYCLRQVYTSFHVCSGNCHMGLEEKTNTAITLTYTLSGF